MMHFKLSSPRRAVLLLLCASISYACSSGGSANTANAMGGSGSGATVVAGNNGPAAGSSVALAGTGANAAGNHGPSTAAGNSAMGTSGSGGKGTAPAGASMDAGIQPAVDGGTAGESDADAGPTCTKQVTSSKDCAAPLAPGDLKTCMAGGRQYFVYAPKNLDLCTPAALVIDAHGAGEQSGTELNGMPNDCVGAGCWNGPGAGWTLEAEAPGGGFILVVPFSATSSNTWDATNDPPVIMQMIEAVKGIANIDPNKIYMTGISNGAGLSYWTACENPGTFAAIAPHSAGFIGGTQCNNLMQPLSVIQFDDEPDFAYMDSQSAVMSMVSIEHCNDGPKTWMTIDSTTTDPICRKDPDGIATTLVPCNTITPAVQTTTCQSWDGCDGGNQIVFCKVAPNTSHGPSNASIDGHFIYENATHLNTPSLAWRFFKSHWK